MLATALAGYGKVLSVSVLNQVVSSGTNFALGIYLVRVLTPTEFGLYGIGFAIVLLYSGLGNALFLTQMVVHVPDKAEEDRLPYASRMLVAVAIFCLLTTLIVSLLIAFGWVWAPLSGKYFGLGMAITAASTAYLLKDFFIRHAYIVRKEAWALYVNIFTALALVGLLLAQYQFFPEINSTSALWIFSASNIGGALFGLVLAQLPILTVSLYQLKTDMREAWVGGKWALTGVGVTWSQTQAYMYVSAIFAGPSAVGYANAARLLIAPALFLMPAVTQLVMPRLATLRTTNAERMFRISWKFTVVMGSFAVVYSAILLGLADEITPVLLGEGYEHVTALVAAWCLVLIFQFLRSGTVIVMQVIKEFRAITLLNAVSLSVAIIIAVFLMQVIGVQGAILGTAAGELIFSMLLYRAISSRNL